MRALLVVDMQNDFLDDGVMGISGARELVPRIEAVADGYELCVGSLDWHPMGHISFVEFVPRNFREHQESVGVKKWPSHCVAFSGGAMPVSGIARRIERYFPKGRDRLVEEYSCMNNNPGGRKCESFLRARGITDIDLAGVALEYCVRATALEGRARGFNVRVLLPLTRAHEWRAGNFVCELRKSGIEVVDAL